MAKPADKTSVAGWFCIAMGLYIIAIAAGWLDVPADSIHAPRWVLGLAGLVFVIGGAMIFAGSRSRLSAIGATVICLCFGLIGSWIALFAPPESISGGLPFLSGTANGTIGKWVFGCGALIAFGIAAVALRESLKPES